MSVEPTSLVCSGPTCRSTSSTPISGPRSLGCWSFCRSSGCEVKCRLLSGGFHSAVSLWAGAAASDSRTSSCPLFFGLVSSSPESHLVTQRPPLPGCSCHSPRKQRCAWDFASLCLRSAPCRRVRVVLRGGCQVPKKGWTQGCCVVKSVHCTVLGGGLPVTRSTPAALSEVFLVNNDHHIPFRVFAF